MPWYLEILPFTIWQSVDTHIYIYTYKWKHYGIYQPYHCHCSICIFIYIWLYLRQDEVRYEFWFFFDFNEILFHQEQEVQILSSGPGFQPCPTWCCWCCSCQYVLLATFWFPKRTMEHPPLVVCRCILHWKWRHLNYLPCEFIGGYCWWFGNPANHQKASPVTSYKWGYSSTYSGEITPVTLLFSAISRGQMSLHLQLNGPGQLRS